MNEKTGARPEIAYWHLWTDGDGVSHQTRCALTEFELKGVGGAAPQWNNKQDRSEATVVYTVQPVGWVGDWHENPAPQWIVVLSGRWWIESMDGTRIEQGPGEFSLGEDQGCKPHGRTQRPPIRDYRRRAGGADDGAAARSPYTATPATSSK